MDKLDNEPSRRRLNVLAAELADLSRRISEHRAFLAWLTAGHQRRVHRELAQPGAAHAIVFDQQHAMP